MYCLLIAYALCLIAHWLPIDIPSPPYVLGPLRPPGPNARPHGPPRPGSSDSPAHGAEGGNWGMSIGNQ